MVFFARLSTLVLAENNYAMTAAPKFTVLDLFCGAGGLSLGLARAGLTTILAVDNNKAALQTYTTNLGRHTAELDLSKEVALPETTAVVGGPPCQGFSSAGLRQRNDHRNSLVGCFSRIVAELRPLAFIFENVEGFLTAEGGDRVIELLGRLSALAIVFICGRSMQQTMAYLNTASALLLLEV
jgi:DNA (cytosine-5)-methyltransferase 1